MDLKSCINSSLCFNAEFVDCITVLVGPGQSNEVKTIPVLPEYKCPVSVNKTNWIGGYGWPDEFAVVQIGSQINVTRTDSTGPWQMNLTFFCCPEEGTFRSFIISRDRLI